MRVYAPGPLLATKDAAPTGTMRVLVVGAGRCAKATYYTNGVPVMQGYVSRIKNQRVYTSGRWWDFI